MHNDSQARIRSRWKANEIKLNDEQRIVYNKIVQSVNNEDGKLFFLDAPTGTGNTCIAS